MKTIKYTAVALALIATASFSSTAHAADGDIILGIYDTNAGVDNNNNSLEVDLGAYNTLAAGETFNLGSSISSVFSNSGATLVFDIFGTGNGTGGGGLSAAEVAIGATTLPTVGNFKSNATPKSNIGLVYTFLPAGASVATGTSSGVNTPFTVLSVPNSSSGSFATAVNNVSTPFGYGASVVAPVAYLPTATLNLYTINDGGGRTAEKAVASGIAPAAYPTGDLFSFSPNANGVSLTFDPVATPEPSAYALGLCAAALFWVLNRRRSVA